MESIILFLLPFVITALVGWGLVKQSRHKVARIDVKEYVPKISYTVSDDRCVGRSKTDDTTPKTSKSKRADMKSLEQSAKTMLQAFTE